MKANHTLALAVSALLAFSFAAGDADAQRRAYELVAGVAFDGMQFRRDIGYRAIEK